MRLDGRIRSWTRLSDNVHRTHNEDGRERGERRGRTTGNTYGLDALEDRYPQEVHVGRTMKLFPQILEDEVERSVLLYYGHLRHQTSRA